MNSILNIALVLSLIANVILGWKRSRVDTTRPEVPHVRLSQTSIIPQERLFFASAEAAKELVREQPSLAIPWALMKEGSFPFMDKNDFGIPDTILLGLELSKPEQRALDSAIGKMRKALREIELAGLQESDDHIVQVDVDQVRQQAALRNFAAELEQTLPGPKSKILAEAAAAGHYLKSSSLQLEVIERKGEMQIKVAFFLDRSGKGDLHFCPLTSHNIPDLRERWGHVVDFDALETVLKANENPDR